MEVINVPHPDNLNCSEDNVGGLTAHDNVWYKAIKPIAVGDTIWGEYGANFWRDGMKEEEEKQAAADEVPLVCSIRHSHPPVEKEEEEEGHQ